MGRQGRLYHTLIDLRRPSTIAMQKVIEVVVPDVVYLLLLELFTVFRTATGLIALQLRHHGGAPEEEETIDVEEKDGEDVEGHHRAEISDSVSVLNHHSTSLKPWPEICTKQRISRK